MQSVLNLGECFNSSRFSDLVVKTTLGTFHVHKVIVCSLSRFFNGACTAGFEVEFIQSLTSQAFSRTYRVKESQSNIIELLEDDPIAVSTMLEWFYDNQFYSILERISPMLGLKLKRQVQTGDETGNESEDKSKTDHGHPSSYGIAEKDVFELCIKVLLLADKFGIPILVTQAIDAFERIADTLERLLLYDSFGRCQYATWMQSFLRAGWLAQPLILASKDLHPVYKILKETVFLCDEYFFFDGCECKNLLYAIPGLLFDINKMQVELKDMLDEAIIICKMCKKEFSWTEREERQDLLRLVEIELCEDCGK